MTTFPRSQNGYVDDGKLISATNRRNQCPKCGSLNYRETISLEECKSCGLRCDYWGGGGNQVYNKWLDALHQRELEQERERIQQEIQNEMQEREDW